MVRKVRSIPRRGFAIKDCALATIALGRRAMSLRELREILVTIHPGSIYCHFWGGLLRPRYQDREFKNDFATWAWRALHDQTLAERLSVIDPTQHSDIEELRHELIDTIDERLDEVDYAPWARRDQQFYFMRAQIVVFLTDHLIEEPEDLAVVLPRISTGSVFYHFIDARSRTDEHIDDFRAWLLKFSPRYDDLVERLAHVDPYFESLTELRDELSGIFAGYFGGNSRDIAS